MSEDVKGVFNLKEEDHGKRIRHGLQRGCWSRYSF